MSKLMKPKKLFAKDVYIRWMIRRDLPEVLRIEEGAFNVPWTEEEIIGHLRNRHTICMVIEDDDHSIQGYMMYNLWKHSLELLSIAINPDWHGFGYGRAMISKLVNKLSAPECGRRDHVSTAVLETNLDAQLFFRSMGFVADGIAKDSDGDTYYSMIYRYGWPTYGDAD